MHNKTNFMRNTERSPEGFLLLRGRAWPLVHRGAVGSAREGKGKGSGGGHDWTSQIRRRPSAGTRRGGRSARSAHGEDSGRAARTKEDGGLPLAGKATSSPPNCFAGSRVKTRSSDHESAVAGLTTGRGSGPAGRSWGWRLVNQIGRAHV